MNNLYKIQRSSLLPCNYVENQEEDKKKIVERGYVTQYGRGTRPILGIQCAQRNIGVGSGLRHARLLL